MKRRDLISTILTGLAASSALATRLFSGLKTAQGRESKKQIGWMLWCVPEGNTSKVYDFNYHRGTYHLAVFDYETKQYADDGYIELNSEEYCQEICRRYHVGDTKWGLKVIDCGYFPVYEPDPK